MKIKVIYKIAWRVYGCRQAIGKFTRFYHNEADYERQREFDLIVIYGKLHMFYNEKKTRMLSIDLIDEKVEEVEQ